MRVLSSTYRLLMTKGAHRAFSFPVTNHRTLANSASLTKHFGPSARFPLPSGHNMNKRLAQMGALGLALGASQYFLGDAKDFFDHKFITSKDTDDLADFYGTEDFMEIFCVLPFMVNLMMRNATFDDDGTIHAWGLLGPGELEVSVKFDEKNVDTTGDGEPDTVAWFNKREHFHDVAPAFLGGFTLWEMTQNFGYRLLEDGTCEVYHHGESFNGLFPLRLLFQLHSRYVIWATERYINSDAFGSDCDEEAEEVRQNVPLHVFKQFLDGLIQEVEKAKDKSTVDSTKRHELEVTLQRLKTISRKDHEEIMPRLRTMRTRKTRVAQVHLQVDDAETKDTVRTAMQQIGSSEGQRHEPASEMNKLLRRTTMITHKDLSEQKEADD